MHIHSKKVSLRCELANVKEPIKNYDDGTTVSIIISYDELTQHTSLLDFLYLFYDGEFSLSGNTFVRYSGTLKQQALRIYYDDEGGMYIVLVLYTPTQLRRLPKVSTLAFNIITLYSPRLMDRSLFT